MEIYKKDLKILIVSSIHATILSQMVRYRYCIICMHVFCSRCFIL